MSEIQFAQGVNVRKKEFSNGGFIIKLGINMNEFYEKNPTNEKGYVNIDIKESKKGNWYAEVNTYNPKSNAKEETNYSEDNEEIVNFGGLEDEDFPF